MSKSKKVVTEEPKKVKISKKQQPTPQIDEFQHLINDNNYEDEYEDIKPLVTIKVSVKDVLEDNADKLVKIMFEKLKAFNNDAMYETKYSVSVTP